MIGKIFDNRYQIVEKLGAGGTAIVYRGQDTLLNRAVTIKILREEYASNAEFVRRFQHEAQAIASLSHPNIVGVYDVGYEENMHYIVMEFVEGESLKEYIKRKGVLKLSEACNIITQILAGVEHAHEHGIIHRDIKPHNILLGRDGRAKVTDFGIAVGLSEVTMTYNSTSRIMGSVHYISPEQVQGLQVTEKSDIYSAGVVFYEMLTGRLPFVGETPISIAMQHVQGELILPHQVNPDVPMGVSYVVMRAMRKNPETRYASALEMAEAVKAAYTGQVDAAAGDEGIDGAAVPVKNNRRPRNKGEERTASAPPRKLDPMRIVLMVLAAALVVGIVLVAGRLENFLQTENAKVTVPTLTGQSIEQAQAALTELGLEANVTEKTSDTVPAGQVMTQSIAPEQQVSPGRVIDLTVSSGPEMVLVPNLVGTSQRIAELTLTNLGLTASVTTEFNEEIAKGEVITQSPLGDTQAAPGTIVQILVSDGKEPEKFVMRDLVGVDKSEALAYIEEKGLTLVSISPATSYDYAADKITSQSIVPNTQATTGDEITLVVSQGPGPTLKTYAFSYQVPQDYDEDGQPVDVQHTVSISVTDVSGTREAYNQTLSGGSMINTQIEYNGSGSLVLSIDGTAVYNVTL